jgi:hypothetical protein
MRHSVELIFVVESKFSANSYIYSKQDIKTRLGRDNLIYNSIRSTNIQSTKAASLLGGPPRMAPAVAGMVESGDGRILTGGLKMDLPAKQTTTASVDQDWYCYKCPQHCIRPAIRIRGEAGESPIQAIILADQSFPAILPVESSSQCFKIFRIENGSISSMVDKLLKDVGNRRIPPGSIILIGSITHLADVGLSAYIEDMIEAERRIKASFSRDVKVGPLPPTTLTGLAVPSVIRELFEYMTWALDYFPDVALEDSMQLAATIFRENGEGVQNYLEPRRLRLPSRDEAKFKLWHSGGSTPPPSPSQSQC